MSSSWRARGENPSQLAITGTMQALVVILKEKLHEMALRLCTSVSTVNGKSPKRVPRRKHLPDRMRPPVRQGFVTVHSQRALQSRNDVIADSVPYFG